LGPEVRKCCCVARAQDDEKVRGLEPATVLVGVIGDELTQGMTGLCHLKAGGQILPNDDVESAALGHD
jgi:hypothetical protein